MASLQVRLDSLSIPIIILQFGNPPSRPIALNRATVLLTRKGCRDLCDEAVLVREM